MGPFVRKLALTAHITSSVGWLGAVAGSLGLGVAGLASRDPQLVSAVYLTMEPVGWFVLLPFSLVSLLTGLVVSLGSKWGLFRHYWVLIKLLMNLFATIILLMYLQTLGYLADLAADDGGLRALRDPSPVVHAGGALVLLLVATTLSVYKPRGLTRYGQRALLSQPS